VIRLAGQVVPLKINAEKDEGPTVAKKYGIQGYPTILFINAAGEVEGKIGGYLPPEGFSQQMAAISRSHAEFPALVAKFKAHPNDSDLAALLAGAYAGRGKIEEAEAALAVAEKGSPKEKGALAKAYNAVGDFYQEKTNFDKAIPLFQKGAKAGSDPNDIAYSHMSVAACYFSQKKFSEAIPSLESTINLPNCPKDMMEQAKQMLAAAKKNADK
jgi:tetratricopeptide (TPR) repeat protein